MIALRFPSRPHPVEWLREKTALVAVGMQDGFLKPGGYFDHAGHDLTHAPGTIAMVGRVLAAGRAAGLMVAFIQSGFDARHTVVGGPTAPV